ncbi:MAG: DegT/DnrJ/EryC1/StrS family aminotransferase [Chlorobiaceae bacterium]
MQFIDLLSQKDRIRKALLHRFESILDRGQFIMGPEVTELESRLASYVGSRHCVSCSSGTDALLMPLLAKGIGPGDAVLTTPFTFFATAEVINLAGATPIFVDVCPDTFAINPELIGRAVEEALAKGLNPKALIPIDLFGLPADYERIEPVAASFNLWILEDAAQSFGGSFKAKKAGSFGHVGATSFFPAKPLGAYGDGGAIFTDDDELDVLLRSVRVHGSGADKYNNERIGINGRLDSLQAAVLLEKLAIFDDELESRQRIADAYSKKLQGRVVVPWIPEHYLSAWAQYSVLAASAEEREQLILALQKESIPSMIYYKIPLHLQKAYAFLNYKTGDFPVSEDLSNRIFSLPMHPYLKEEDVNRICEVLLA